MIGFAFKEKGEQLKNQAIVQCLNVDLNYLDMRNNEVYEVNRELLQKLNKTKHIEDRRLLTLRINPGGWGSLFNALTFHLEKIIENLKLYKEIKQSYANIGSHISLFSYLLFQKTLKDKLGNYSPAYIKKSIRIKH